MVQTVGFNREFKQFGSMPHRHAWSQHVRIDNNNFLHGVDLDLG